MNDQTLSDELELVAKMFDASNLFLLLVGIIIILTGNWCIRHFSARMMNRLPSRRFLIMQMSTLVTFILYILGTVVLIMGVLRPPREFLLAIGGSAAVALGFALKDVAASMVSGVLLLFDRPFQVGDRVSFNGSYGEIISISLRSVRLQTLDDNIVTIPNSRFITDMVASGNMGAMDMMVVTDFHVGLEADVEKARDIIRQVIVTSRYAYLKKPVAFAVEEMQIAERLAIRIRAKAYVLDVRYEKAFQSDITTRVTKLFADAQITRPAWS